MITVESFDDMDIRELDNLEDKIDTFTEENPKIVIEFDGFPLNFEENDVSKFFEKDAKEYNL